jgi:hypothetical protein
MSHVGPSAVESAAESARTTLESPKTSAARRDTSLVLRGDVSFAARAAEPAAEPELPTALDADDIAAPPCWATVLDEVEVLGVVLFVGA